VVVATAAKIEPVRAQLTVAVVGDTINVFHASNPLKMISIQGWSTASISTMAEFWNLVEHLFPDGIF
jgi:hypothetical protein